MQFLLRLALFITFFLTFNALASKPKISVSVSHLSPFVGQVNLVRVKILVPTHFSTPVYFNEIEALNIYTVKADKSTYPTSETIDGQVWSGVIKEYSLIAMKEGEFTINLPALTVSYATHDKQTSITLQPDPIQFNATIPSVAKSLTPLIIAEDLYIEQNIIKPEQLSAGQSVQRELTITIKDSSALFIPQLLNDSDTDLQRAYLRTPSINDKLDGRTGALIGQRKESQDILLKSAGVLELKELTLRYYQPSTNSIQITTVASEQINIPAAHTSILTTISALIVLIILLLAGYAGYQVFIRYYEKYKHSEAYAFKRIMSTQYPSHQAVSKAINDWKLFWRSAYVQSPQFANDLHTLILDIETQRLSLKQWQLAFAKHRQTLLTQAVSKSNLKPLNP